MDDWQKRAVSAEEVVAHVANGSKVFLHGAAATPVTLLDALCDKPGLEGATLYHLHTEGSTRFVAPEQAGRIFSVSLFTGPGCRKPIEEGRADFMPIFLSDIPGLFRSRQIPLDVAMVQLSPPDRHGLCTLGTSVDAARAAVDSATIVIAEINERMPRTHGYSSIPLSRVKAFVHTDRPLPEHAREPETPVEARIGELITDLVEDRSTLQMGIGGIPDAVLARLGNKHELGVHTEMFSDGLIPLLDGGVVTNQHKKVHPGRTVTSFVSGSRLVFDYVQDNSTVEFHPCDRTNDISLIRKNDKVVAINSA
ncbi:MAG TPA: acetyl-CoA hydrolase/transferase C-terminal domain-containing protein, partial [Polyangiaceae bacterium]|nr:acetyl-CoA hydrolase/transferase C-terminal domain-containing protein [Polyangiaceae bacterium]